MCIPWSKAMSGNFVNSETDYLKTPTFQVASCWLYLLLFSNQLMAVYFPVDVSAPSKILYFTTPCQKFLLLPEIRFLPSSLKL
jgi:hypothetical protein